jgi:hypothetical protein
MSDYSAQELIYSMQQSGSAVTATSATTLLSSGFNTQNFNFPAIFKFAGKRVKLSAKGVCSGTNNSVALTYSIWFGSTQVCTNTNGALGTIASYSSNGIWIDAEMTCLATGYGSSSIRTNMRISTTALSQGAWVFPPTTTGVTTGCTVFDNSNAYTIDLRGAWSTATGASSIQIFDCDLISLN